ncbi:MAG: hypothetical protein ACE5D4_00060 [Thermodesulfobacteriota bacterium]
MLVRVTAVILAVILLSAASPAFAEKRHRLFNKKPPTPLSFFVGERTWISTGDNEWSIAQIGGTPDILSELEFLDLDSTVEEIYGGFRSGAAAVTVRFGYGNMEGGIYRDSDYLSNDRQDIFSLSTGAADGKDWNDLYYFNAEYSYRFLAGKTKAGRTTTYLGLIAGYQQWHEEVTMTNGFQGVCVAPTCTVGTGAIAGLNSHYTFDWKSFRIGVEGSLPLYGGVNLKGTTVFIPYTSYSGEGIWNLRSDFKQNPSFTHEANGGYGVEIDASLAYRIWKNFEIEAGYRYWFIKSGKGTDTTFSSSGAISTTQLNEAVSERHGAFLDLTFLF